MSVNTLVILPTYNERGNLRPLASQLLTVEPDLGIVVVDDASPDGTGQVADELHRKHLDRVRVIHRPGKLGLGTAYMAGFRLALEEKIERVVTMDADNSHDPGHLPDLLTASRADAALVIGSRYVTGGATPDFPLRRRLLSGLANYAAHAIGGLKARDATSGYRCYSKQVLSALPLESIRSEGYSFLVELLYHAENAGFEIHEVPITFRDREHGVSKISRDEVRRAIRTVLRLGLKRIVGFRESTGR